MITQKMIRNGFKRGVISLENEFGGCIELCCRIGDGAFYFAEGKARFLSAEKYRKTHTLNKTVDALYKILKSPKSAEENGIDEDEYNYYEAILQQNSGK